MRFFKTVLSTISFLTLVCFAQPGHGGILYIESVSGDLSDSAGGPGTAIFNLTAGNNTIRGTAGPSDTDDFYVLPNAGLSITGGLFTAVFSGGSGGIYNSSAVPIVGGGIFQGTIMSNTSVSIAAFSDGLFRTQNGDSTVTSPAIVWQYDFTVVDPSAVPEPSSMALWGLGVFGLGLARRKRRNKAANSP